MTSHELAIRPAAYIDQAAVWTTLEPAIRAGETLALDRDLTRASALDYWFSARHEVFVAEQEGTVVGTYLLRANEAGGGAHVANAVYVVSPSATGRGIAQSNVRTFARPRAQAWLLGDAIRFPYPASEERRLKLWQRAGFKVLATLPKRSSTRASA